MINIYVCEKSHVERIWENYIPSPAEAINSPIIFTHIRKENKEQAKRVSVPLHTRQEERREGGNNERMKHVKIEQYHLD